jgi:hypothetical protein
MCVNIIVCHHPPPVHTHNDEHDTSPTQHFSFSVNLVKANMTLYRTSQTTLCTHLLGNQSFPPLSDTPGNNHSSDTKLLRELSTPNREKPEHNREFTQYNRHATSFHLADTETHRPAIHICAQHNSVDWGTPSTDTLRVLALARLTQLAAASLLPHTGGHC